MTCPQDLRSKSTHDNRHLFRDIVDEELTNKANQRVEKSS